MRYSDSHKQETHQRIVDSASALLRESGVNGIGVADLMRSVGLTHGGFYAHFESKEQLVAEAVSIALGQTIARLRAAADGVPRNVARQALVDSYLDARHRDNPGKGCAAAALGADVSRLGPEARTAFEQRLEEIVELLQDYGGGRGDGRKKALVLFSTLVGAMVLARAVKSKAVSEEILQAAREAA